MFNILILLPTGLALLYLGAEGLVRGSSSLALKFRISPLIIGLTVVAYGTSSPELVISLKTALSGHGAIAVGNVIGSNIFNIAVILGLSSILYPLRIQVKLLRLDAPIMIAVSLVLLIVFRDFYISRSEGFILLIGAISYTAGNLILAQNERPGKEVEREFTEALEKKTLSFRIDGLLIGAGLLSLVIGSQFFVNGAIELARIAGLSEAIIGITIVAAGTSLPELATSVVAALKKEPDIAIGNIIGSNIFNILAILGCSSLVSPLNGIGINMTDLYVMAGFSILLFPMLWSGFILKRSEGIILLILYIVFIYYRLPK